MKWSWKIAEISGIGIYVHATFWLLIVFVAASHLVQDTSVSAAAAGVGFILALFGCVVLHELGHALVARRFGIRTRDITLLPIGGVARLERMPEKPLEELQVALAGPAVSIAVAAAIFAGLFTTARLLPLDQLTVVGGSFFERLMLVNLFLALFNLIPAFPMDGGRALRAILGIRMGYARATYYAAVIGQGLALVFGLIGFFTNPMLMFIALFVWIGASQESSAVQVKAALSGIPVTRAMITDFHAVRPSDTLAEVVRLILAGSQQDFPVVGDSGQVVGVLTRSDLLAALSRRGESGVVADSMQRDFQTVEADTTLEQASTALQSCSCHTLPVLNRGALAGLVTLENIGEFMMIRAALEADGRTMSASAPRAW
jgi:Zn-dependent protease/CBS domain-containing protein